MLRNNEPIMLNVTIWYENLNNYQPIMLNVTMGNGMLRKNINQSCATFVWIQNVEICLQCYHDFEKKPDDTLCNKLSESQFEKKAEIFCLNESMWLYISPQFLPRTFLLSSTYLFQSEWYIILVIVVIIIIIIIIIIINQRACKRILTRCKDFYK